MAKLCLSIPCFHLTLAREYKEVFREVYDLGTYRIVFICIVRFCMRKFMRNGNETIHSNSNADVTYGHLCAPPQIQGLHF